MKKIAASVGLIALGASCVQAADESYSTAEAGKIWTVSASLRGFYDDNFEGYPSGPQRVGTFGVSVIPGFNLNWQRDMNTLILGYTYKLTYNEKRHSINNSHIDQNHNFNGEFSHTFNERLSAKVSDVFVIGQHPGRLDGGAIDSSASSTLQPYISGDNIRNTAAVVVNAELTPLFGLEGGYDNSFFDYSDSGASSTNYIVNPSLSGTSDRIEHSFHLDGRWSVTPQTTAFVGYKFSMADYTGNELIGYEGALVGTNVVYSPLMSKDRNSRSHYGYVGADHIFNPDLQGSAKAGLRLTDYYNNGNSDVSPYVNLALTYAYAPESYLQGGFTYDRNATDMVGISATEGITRDQQSAVVFASLHHRIVPNLFGSVTGQFQHSTFVGGPYDSGTERTFLLGLNLSYKFSRYLSADVGYDYDNVSSDAGRSYDRNKVYVGITGSY